MAEEQRVIDELAQRRTDLNAQFTARRKLKTEQAAELAASCQAPKGEDAETKVVANQNIEAAVYDKKAARARAGKDNQNFDKQFACGDNKFSYVETRLQVKTKEHQYKPIIVNCLGSKKTTCPRV